MKRIYSTPITEIDIAEPMQIICASPVVNVTKGAEWGAAAGDFSPGEWINENYSGSKIGTFDVVTATEENDWKSRSNTGLFD